MTRPAVAGPFWRRHAWWLGAIVVLGLAVALPLLHGLSAREPVYAQQPLSHWLAELAVADTNRVAAARTALHALGPAAVPSLVRWLQPHDDLAGRPLAWIRPFLPLRLYASLHRSLGPGAASVARRQALQGCLELGPAAEPARPAIEAIARNGLARSQPVEWTLAVHWLGRAGGSGPAVLAAILPDTPPSLRTQVLIALSQCGTNAIATVPAVLALVPQRPDDHWEALPDYLGPVAGPTALPGLFAWLDPGSGPLRGIALMTLERLLQSDPGVRQAFCAQLPGQPAPIRRDLIELLGRLDADRVLVARAMLQALDDPDATMRGLAMDWLAQRLSPAARTRLLEAEPAARQAQLRNAPATRQLWESAPSSAPPREP